MSRLDALRAARWILIGLCGVVGLLAIYGYFELEAQVRADATALKIAQTTITQAQIDAQALQKNITIICGGMDKYWSDIYSKKVKIAGSDQDVTGFLNNLSLARNTVCETKIK